MNDKIHDVIVIGGGFAGVRAYRDLRVAGRDAILLEARDRLGGRTWYREFEGTTHKIEIGGTWTVDRRQPNVTAEKARYGIGTVTSPRAETWQMRLDGKVRDSALPVEIGEIAELEHAIYHLIHDSHRITPGIPYDQQGLDDLDIPFERWMEDRAITGGTKAFLSAFIGLNLGCGPDEVSVVHFLTWITNMGNSPWTMHSVLTEKFAGGSTSVLDAMIAEVGGEVRLSTPVARVEQGPDGVTVTTRAGDVMHARTAIVATPLNTWRDIDFSPPLERGEVGGRSDTAQRSFGEAVGAGQERALVLRVLGMGRWHVLAVDRVRGRRGRVDGRVRGFSGHRRHHGLHRCRFQSRCLPAAGRRGGRERRTRLERRRVLTGDLDGVRPRRAHPSAQRPHGDGRPRRIRRLRHRAALGRLDRGCPRERSIGCARGERVAPAISTARLARGIVIDARPHSTVAGSSHVGLRSRRMARPGGRV